MVTILNRNNLPDTIVRATKAINAKYSKGNAERSVTQLIAAPRVDQLRKRYYHEIEQDIEDMWWSVFGSAVHHILEMGAGPGQVTEERIFAKVAGMVISGQADLQEEKGACHLMDYKVTTAYPVMLGEDKVEWENQLNLLAYLIWLDRGVRVESLSIIAFVRDWKRGETVDPNYPQAGIVKVPMKLWEISKQKSYTEERIKLHRQAEMLASLDLPLPHCTREERWQKDDKFAVLKNGGKKALRVYPSLKEAADDVAARKTQDYFVETRPGKSYRCEGNFCQVSHWCEQYQEARSNETEQEQA